MDILYSHCCGLDVHKKTVVACLLTPGADGQPAKAIRTFSTMTADLLALADWLAAAGCTHVAMESTGVYWKPIYNLFEQRFELLLVNARHSKAAPGRKTDVRDSEWLADLLQHGLLRGSFVPDREQRELRELTRYRLALVRERTAEANRLQKTLEGANIKLAAVATDILGVSGRQILEALVGGSTDASAMADLAQGQLRKKIPQLEQALTGQVDAHQRFLIRRHLRQIDGLDTAIAEVSTEIAERVRPFEAVIDRLDTIPGIGRYVAEALIAEIGVDMSRFRARAIWPRGPGCVRAITRARGSARAERHAKAVPGCAPCSFRPRMRLAARGRPILPLSTGAWRRGVARSGRP
jgi:transposase